MGQASKTNERRLKIREMDICKENGKKMTTKAVRKSPAKETKEKEKEGTSYRNCQSSSITCAAGDEAEV